MTAILHPFTASGAIVTVSVCVATDLATRRIPNTVTWSAMLAGTALNTAMHGSTGFVSALSGLLLGLMILIPPFAVGGIGGGDVKMMGSVGAFVGPWPLLISLITGLVFGGIVAAIAAARRGRFVETLTRAWVMVRDALLTRSAEPLKAPGKLPGQIILPYSVPLALGTVTTVLGWMLVA